MKYISIEFMKYLIILLLISTPAFASIDWTAPSNNDGYYDRQAEQQQNNTWQPPQYVPVPDLPSYNDRNDRNDSVGQQIYDCAQTSSCQGQFSRQMNNNGM
jgi:ABC-type proline/glycine betaine transport system substrate-binding protein